MKKIGVITLGGYFNYGNRLQNYAVENVLENLGFEVCTILHETKNPRYIRDIYYYINLLKKNNFFDLVKKIENRLHNYWSLKEKEKYIDNEDLKIQNIKAFSKKYLSETHYCISPNNIPVGISNNFDYLVVGSDQVWNNVTFNSSTIRFLKFAPIHKRISYAASFGVSEIVVERQELYKEGLSEFAYISVREESGANIVRELTGREVPILVDPTMMLTREDWLSISNVSVNKPKTPYLLTYFLGDIARETRDLIRTLSKEHDLEVVHLGRYEDLERYADDPSAFIDYINSASIFLTDSFHGGVFSILLERPFIIFDRICRAESMLSRLDTLLSTFELESRKWEKVKDSQNYFNIDFSHIYPILERERKRTYDYLQEALDLK